MASTTYQGSNDMAGSNNPELRFLERRLDVAEQRLGEIDIFKGRTVAYDLAHKQFKEDLEDIRRRLSFLKDEMEEEFERVDDIFRDPEKGVFTHLRELDKHVLYLEKLGKSIELKFDTKFAQLEPEIFKHKITTEILRAISGERLEKLEITIRQSEKENQWKDRIIHGVISAVVSGAIAAGFAFLHGC